MFSREDLPLATFYPETSANLEQVCANSKMKIIQIEVNRGEEFKRYIVPTIDAIQKAYSQKDEIPVISNIKDKFADMAKQILSAPEVSAFQKKMAFKDLIKMYAAIDACPDTILNYYALYQNDLKMIDEDFKISKQELLKKSFRDFDQWEQEEQKLKGAMQANKKKELGCFFDDISKCYDQLPRPSFPLAEVDTTLDSKTVAGIAEHTVPVTTTVQNEIVDFSGKDGKKERTTPFWSEKQPVEKAPITEQLAGLTI